MPPHAKGGGFSGSVGDPTAQNISRSAQSLSWRAFTNTADAKERMRAHLSGHDDEQKGSAFFWKIPFTTISREAPQRTFAPESKKPPRGETGGEILETDHPFHP